jgi:hypothetical protein
VSMKVTQRSASDISRLRGANVISKAAYDDISPGKGCQHHDDLYARTEPAGYRREESTRLMIVIDFYRSRRGSPGVQLCSGNRLLLSAGDAFGVRCFSLSGKEFANVIQFIS